eukprot:NODE_9309_length_1433_cov_3.311639.p1 GENE.NODE_9309_length_1433_cov_3.311639~~NODE_9309_length_1433_cov_3.311639.p1  ORF type:complete len:354 (+),score=119.84 NODE_9309_length_1433_cov_3.311639:1-1062(+)
MMGSMPATSWCDPPIRSQEQMMNALTQKPARIDESTSEVAALVRRESAVYGIPPSRVVLCGFSLGGCPAGWAALQMTMPIAGLILLSSMILAPSYLVLSGVHQQVPVLQCHGRADPQIPMFGAQLTKQQLETTGLSVQWHEDDCGHTASEKALELALEFLARKLPEVPTLNVPALREEAARAAEPYALLPLELEPVIGRIPDATAVTVRGLKSQPQHNGVCGHVIGHIPASGRLMVRLPGVDVPIGLKPQNLTQHVKATIAGAGGTVIDFNDEAGTFQVQFGDTGLAPNAVPADAVRLPLGTYVRIVGLTSEKGMQLNDRFGRLKAFDEEQQRYVVDLGAGGKHRLKPANVLP